MERIRLFSLPDSGILTFRAAGRLWVNACYIGRMRRAGRRKRPVRVSPGGSARDSRSARHGTAWKTFNEPQEI